MQKYAVKECVNPKECRPPSAQFYLFGRAFSAERRLASPRAVPPLTRKRKPSTVLGFWLRSHAKSVEVVA
jgi:hypothetical protein